jgi:molybdopterin-guanine dinucleotide biosynthesis protein A
VSPADARPRPAVAHGHAAGPAPALVAILAGGAGRRMGAPKALALLGGRPLIAWPLAAAAAAGLEAVVVAKPDTPLPELAVPVWLEPAEPSHPLLGIVTALEIAGGAARAEGARPPRAIVAVGCDQPWLAPELLRSLALGGPGAAAPRGERGPAPLPARYPPEALGALRAALAAEAPLRATLAALDPAVIEVDDPSRLASLNTPAALAEAERIASGAA